MQKRSGALATNEGGTAVNRRDARLNEVVGRLSAVGVDGRTDDVGLLLSDDLGTAVSGATCTVENATDQVGAHGELEHIAHEGDTGVSVDFGRAFKHLNDDKVIGGIEHLPVLDVPVGKAEGNMISPNATGSVLFKKTSGPFTSVMVRYSFPVIFILSSVGLHGVGDFFVHFLDHGFDAVNVAFFEPATHQV